MTEVHDYAKSVLTEFLDDMGVTVTYHFAAGGTADIVADFREQMSTETRDRRGGRINVRRAVAHVHYDDVPSPSLDDAITYKGDKWVVEEINPQTASSRFDLRLSSRLERSGGKITEERV